MQTLSEASSLVNSKNYIKPGLTILNYYADILMKENQNKTFVPLVTTNETLRVILFINSIRFKLLN
jgi:hypothetical protein